MTRLLGDLRNHFGVYKKEDYKYVEICEMQMRENSLIKWDNIIELFRKWLKDTSRSTWGMKGFALNL